MVMFAIERELENSSLLDYKPDQGIATQLLFAEETLSMGRFSGEFDASLEETLHLVTLARYAYAYPEAFEYS